MNFLQNVAVEVIKCGPMPKHIAVILDGNRTYSRQKNIDLSVGYNLGFKKALEVLDWGYAMGTEQVSAYSFSIENFNRSKEEVNRLMNHARDWIKTMIENEDLIKKGIRIKCLGKLSLLPKDLNVLMVELMEKTKNGKQLTFNLMVAYTSREEISHSMRTNVEHFLENKIDLDEITEESISKSLYVDQPVDILFRSSGVTRLSDYMMWQLDSSPLCFVEKTWPAVEFWDIIMSVFYYQVTYKRMTNVKTALSIK